MDKCTDESLAVGVVYLDVLTTVLSRFVGERPCQITLTRVNHQCETIRIDERHVRLTQVDRFNQLFGGRCAYDVALIAVLRRLFLALHRTGHIS